jgi:alpha-beta hydrolase superfamily lysophospholipase
MLAAPTAVPAPPQRVSRVGHSSGAVIALEAALASPASFAGLVLHEPPVAVTMPLGGGALARANEALAAGDAGRALKIRIARRRNRPLRTH